MSFFFSFSTHASLLLPRAFCVLRVLPLLLAVRACVQYNIRVRLHEYVSVCVMAPRINIYVYIYAGEAWLRASAPSLALLSIQR